MTERVFVLSSKPHFSTKIKTLLPSFLYSPVSVFPTLLQCKNSLRTQNCDLLIIHDALSEGPAWKIAREIHATFHTEMLVLVSSKTYDQVIYQLQNTGIFVLAFPIKAQDILQALEILRTKREEIEAYQAEISKLKNKIYDDRLINRAKMVLIESYHWSEDKAHHYIEQVSMQNSLTKVDVAKQLIEGLNT